MDDIFPYNAGIMLMNMPYLRQTNKQFIDWILEQRNGLYFDGEPPAWFNRVDCLLGSSDSHKLILLNNWSLWLFWHRVRSTGPGCHQPILREGDQGQAHQQGMARPPARSPARPPALPPIHPSSRPPSCVVDDKCLCCLDAGLQCQALPAVPGICSHRAPAWVRQPLCFNCCNWCNNNGIHLVPSHFHMPVPNSLPSLLFASLNAGQSPTTTCSGFAVAAVNSASSVNG